MVGRDISCKRTTVCFNLVSSEPQDLKLHLSR